MIAYQHGVLSRAARLWSALWLVSLVSSAVGQTLVDLDAIPPSGLHLSIRRLVQLPLDSGGVVARVSSLTTAPGDGRLFVTTHGYNNNGSSTARIYAINLAPSGPQVSLFLPLGAFLNNVNGPIANAIQHTREGGLKSLAFHPDFSNPGTPGYRKFYTSLQEATASGNPSLPYVGTTAITDMSDSVVGEWTVGANGVVDVNSYREVLRVALDWYAHPAQDVGFNPFSRPGDEDYGLLYFSHGDGGLEPTGTGQVGTNALGKLLRVNPLHSGASSYTIPSTNPFTAAKDPNDQVLDAVYAMGLRNATHFSWAKDDQGTVRMILGDIGNWNVEEVNIIEAGGNYGWRNREGTFVNINGGEGKGIGYGITHLPANDAALNNFIYPAAQYGHSGPVGVNGPPAAVRGGFVIQNGSEPTLQGQYVFGDFPETGKVLTASFAALLAAKTRLADGDLPTSLAPVTIREMGILFDNDDNPATPSVPMSMRDVVISGPGYDGSGRIDLVFGQGIDGELYFVNKRNGWVYLASNTTPLGPPGDFDYNHLVEAADLAVWEDEFGLKGSVRTADADHDSDVDGADFLVWQRNLGARVAIASTSLGSSATPEPGTATLAAFASVALLAFRRTLISAC